MPSGDNSSGSDIDPCVAVRYALQCDYPERIDFGPDKHGAFFGDVELGRIVQEEPAADVSQVQIPLLPLPGFEFNSPEPGFTPVNVFTPSSALLKRSTSQSDSTCPSDHFTPSHSDCHSSQVEKASHVAERASFINNYSETYSDPDVSKLPIVNDFPQESRPSATIGPPPDYVRISIVLLLCSPPCAGIALFWALKARKHMLKGENSKAWQLSNKVFYCLLLGLFCFFVVLVSWSLASLFDQIKNNHPKVPSLKPTTKTHQKEISDIFLERGEAEHDARQTDDNLDKSHSNHFLSIKKKKVPTATLR